MWLERNVSKLLRARGSRKRLSCPGAKKGLEAVQNIATLHASNLANVCTARRAGGLSVWSVAPIQNAPAAERVVATIDSGIGLVPEADDAEFRLL